MALRTCIFAHCLFGGTKKKLDLKQSITKYRTEECTQIKGKQMFLSVVLPTFKQIPSFQMGQTERYENGETLNSLTFRRYGKDDVFTNRVELIVFTRNSWENSANSKENSYEKNI